MNPDRVGWAALGFSPTPAGLGGHTVLDYMVPSYMKGALAWNPVNASSIGARGKYEPAMYHSQCRTPGPLPLMEEESLEMVLVM